MPGPFEGQWCQAPLEGSGERGSAGGASGVSPDVVVVDIATGDLLDRVDTGSRVANGMFLTAGPDRSIFYCSTLTLARITWS